MNRGAVGPTDVIIALVVVISGIGVAPIYYDMIGPIAEVSDPFSALLLEFVVPSIFLGIIISIGISARRDI